MLTPIESLDYMRVGVVTKRQGEILRLMRDMVGWSQADLASAAGMKHYQQISLYETGARNLGNKTRDKLSKAFSLPREEFDRLMASEGRPELIKVWLKLHEIRSRGDADKILAAIVKIVDLYLRAQADHEKSEIYDHLMRQIDLLEKF